MAFSRSIVREETTSATAEHSADADIDAVYVRRVQDGDVAAFDFLVHKYRERLFSIVYNLTSNREDSADLVQESLIKAFSSIGRFQGKSSFFTWLYRITVNTALSHLKRYRLRRFFSLENINDEASSTEIVEALSVKTRTEKGAIINELHE